MGWDGMGWDGMGWDGMGLNGTDEVGQSSCKAKPPRLVRVRLHADEFVRPLPEEEAGPWHSIIILRLSIIPSMISIGTRTMV